MKTMKNSSRFALRSPPKRPHMCRLPRMVRTALDVELADRDFRKSFSRNYRVLFQPNWWGYRVEVLESVLELTAEIWVNRSVEGSRANVWEKRG